MLERRLEPILFQDLKKKMVFLSGPRQCGKTTLAKKILKSFKSGTYFNWDVSSDRKAILNEKIDLDADLWIFDEIHKYRRWRGFLKGLYDEHHPEHKIFVTGSARLNLYGRGGDSLQGRYFSHHCYPFTLSELEKVKYSGLDSTFLQPHFSNSHSEKTLREMLTYGGFPEPFLGRGELEAKRWRANYTQRLIEEDIRTLESVRELDRLELLLDRLDDIAGSTLSMNALREDLEVSFDAIKNWIEIFERIYACFRISPFGPAKIKAVKKEQKLYLWDWMRAKTPGARLENLIAVHLLRLVDWARDCLGERLDLRYFHVRGGGEVDFILLEEGKPWVALEIKLQEQDLSPFFRYYLERVPTPYAFQIHLEGKNEKILAKIGETKVRSVSASRFLLNLP